jgi:hypothetical protein
VKKIRLNGNLTWFITTCLFVLTTIVLGTLEVTHQARSDTLTAIRDEVRKNAGIVEEAKKISQNALNIANMNANQVSVLQAVTAENTRQGQENRNFISSINSMLASVLENQKDFKADMRDLKRMIK